MSPLVLFCHRYPTRVCAIVLATILPIVWICALIAGGFWLRFDTPIWSAF